VYRYEYNQYGILEKIKCSKKNLTSKIILFTIFSLFCVICSGFFIYLACVGKADIEIPFIFIPIFLIMEIVAAFNFACAYRFEITFDTEEIRIKYRRKTEIFHYSELEGCGFLEGIGCRDLGESLQIGNREETTTKKNTFYFSMDSNLNINELKKYVSALTETEQGFYNKTTFFLSDYYENKNFQYILLTAIRHYCGEDSCKFVYSEKT